jgi:N-acyl-D-aspartate/D-glutamate deacylase
VPSATEISKSVAIPRSREEDPFEADITIFDPETVTDNASWEDGKNTLPSTGIPYVIVNGTVVVKDSKVLKGVYPGQAIRNPVVQ